MTAAERNVWRGLRDRLPALHWRKQVPFGPYFVDFCCHNARLIIEIDGGQHSTDAAREAARTRFLEAEGYRVIRFWNNEVAENIDGVIERIAANLSGDRR